MDTELDFDAADAVHTAYKTRAVRDGAPLGSVLQGYIWKFRII